MADHSALLKKLQIKDGSRVATMPESEPLPPVLLEATTDLAGTLDESDVVLGAVTDRAGTDSLLDAALPVIGHARAAWVLYPKGNRTDINRDSLWRLLVERGWRPISQVAVDEATSAVRIRPLKDGEDATPTG